MGVAPSTVPSDPAATSPEDGGRVDPLAAQVLARLDDIEARLDGLTTGMTLTGTLMAQVLDRLAPVAKLAERVNTRADKLRAAWRG